MATYLSQSTSAVFLDTISDFHLLLFLVTNEVMPLQDSISLLLEAVRTRNEELAQTWKKSEQWATIEQLCSKWPPPPHPRGHALELPPAESRGRSLPCGAQDVCAWRPEPRCAVWRCSSRASTHGPALLRWRAYPLHQRHAS